jgi:hypothetical protein
MIATYPIGFSMLHAHIDVYRCVQLSPTRLPDTVFSSPLFQEVLSAAIENQNADAFFLALQLWEKLPSSTRDSCPLLPNSNSIDALFEPDHLLSLLPVLKV